MKLMAMYEMVLFNVSHSEKDEGETLCQECVSMLIVVVAPNRICG